MWDYSTQEVDFGTEKSQDWELGPAGKTEEVVAANLSWQFVSTTPEESCEEEGRVM